MLQHLTNINLPEVSRNLLRVVTTRPNVRKAFQASGCLDDSFVQTKRIVQAEMERQDGRDNNLL